jgi:splicing factor U2AF subunit
MAIQGLHNFQLGDRTLVVQRAAMGRNTGVSTAMPGSAAFLATASECGYIHAADFANGYVVPNLLEGEEAPPSRILLLLNMVAAEELYDDRDYQEIVEDIHDECSKFGEVEGVRIPRPVPKTKKWAPGDSAVATAEKNRKADDAAGVGRVYVMFKEIESAQAAMKDLGGRQFGGRTILVATVSEVCLFPFLAFSFSSVSMHSE